MTKKINIDNEPDRERAREHMEHLSQFMSDNRLAVLEKVLLERTDYITVCFENIYHAQNASAVLRSCEAFGIQHIHVIEELLPFEPNRAIVRGADKWLDIERHGEKNATVNLINRLKGEGYRIVATSPHSLGVRPEEFDISKGKTAIIIGTEKQGVSQEALDMADEYVTIPMCGFVESLNLSVCTAIVLNALTGKMRHNENIEWRLKKEDMDRLIYKWTLQSVKDYDRILLKYEREKDE
ncbi:MAG: RNA methyltransferase [Rikenellaceae bacterium]